MTAEFAFWSTQVAGGADGNLTRVFGGLMKLVGSNGADSDL